MAMTKWMRIAALALVPMLSACTEDPIIDEDTDPGDDVATIRLQIGQQTVDVGPGGAVLTFDIPRGESTINASFLRQSGTTLTLPSTGEYSVSFIPATPSRMTFTRTGHFSGTLTGLQTGPTTMQVALVHGSHSDFGPHNVTVNVLPPIDN
jgi:hypothetical protein